MKKVLLCILLILVCVLNIFGHETLKNTIYFGIGFFGSVQQYFEFFPGLNLEFERSINEMFSVSMIFGTDIIIVPYVEIMGRWHPWSGAFFAGLGLGIWALFPLVIEPIHTFLPMITPNIGWKFNEGDQNRWVVKMSIGNRIILPYGNEFLFTQINIGIGYKF